MNNPQQTPLEKLISDRRRIQQESTIQEQKLNADFSYIQEMPEHCCFQVSPHSYSLTQKPNPKGRKANSLRKPRKRHPCH